MLHPVQVLYNFNVLGHQSVVSLASLVQPASQLCVLPHKLVNADYVHS